MRDPREYLSGSKPEPLFEDVTQQSFALMRESLSIVIFGDNDDAQVVALKCFLVKHGFANFTTGCSRAAQCRLLERERRCGLFIVSRASVSSAEIEAIAAESRRLAVPLLQL